MNHALNFKRSNGPVYNCDMALFRQHISLGAILAIIGVIVLYFYAVTTDPFELAAVFGLCTLGSLIPDVDSDSGLPFYLMFGTLTVAFGGAALYMTLAAAPQDWRVLVGVPLASLAIFWFGVGRVVRRFTHHRGIWHSVPALLIASTIVYIAARYIGADVSASLLYATAMAAGVASHLLLDEIYSEVSFTGIAIGPKRSVGTAVKLFSHSAWVNLLTYAMLACLLYSAALLS
jgi:membrane-bound metal-dependent hydrolase YbcI (DUF457 family)